MKLTFRSFFPAALLLCVLFLFSGCLGINYPDSEDSPVPADVVTGYPVIFRQVFCTGENRDTPVRYGFIELYNTGDRAVSLAGKSIQYAKGTRKQYVSFPFPADAVIPAGGSYLIRCAKAVDESGEPYLDACEKFLITQYDADFPELTMSSKSTRLILCDLTVPMAAESTKALLGTGHVLAYFSAAADGADAVGPVNLRGINKHTAARRTDDLTLWECVDYEAQTCLSVTEYTPCSSAGKNTDIPLSGVDVIFSQPAGRYAADSLTIELSTLPGYEIRYTLDCGASKRNFKPYSAPITVHNTETTEAGATARALEKAVSSSYLPSSDPAPSAAVLRACVYDGKNYGPVITQSYFVMPSVNTFDDLLMMNLTLPIDAFAGPIGIYHTAEDDLSLKKRKISGYLEVFDPAGNDPEGHCIEVAMNGNGSLGKHQKSMRVYIREQASAGDGDTLYYDLFDGAVSAENGETITAYESFLLRNSGNDCSMAHLRDALMQKLSETLHVDIQAYRPVFVFINGEFWGLYNLRERYDAAYFHAHYGVEKENLVMLESVSPLVTGSYDTPYVVNDGEPGDERDFEEILAYLDSHDMKSEEDLAWIEERVDLDNFTDYLISNCFFANTDWPGNNVKVWRNKNPADPSGLDTRWRFVLADMDFGVGHSTSSSQAMFSYAVSDSTVLGRIMQKMFKNLNYRMRLADRAMELCNSVWREDAMTAVLLDMANTINPYMQYQFRRWRSDRGSLKSWKAELQKTYDFLEDRAPSFISDMGNVLSVYGERFVLNAEHASVTISCDGEVLYTQSGGSLSYYFRDGKQLSLTVTPDEGYSCTAIQYKVGPKEALTEDLTLSLDVIARTTVTVQTVPTGG